MTDPALQVFLLINVFIIGVVASIAARHAYAHFRPHPEDKKARQAEQAPHLPAAVKEQLLLEAKQKFQAAIEHATKELETDLQKSTEQVTKQLHTLATDIVTTELDRYKTTLEALRAQTEASLTSATSEIAAHQTDIHADLAKQKTELVAKMHDEIATEKQQLIAQIDTKLADAVTSFLVETLGHNVDLGAQSDYLISVLDEHKAEFTKRVTDEV